MSVSTGQSNTLQRDPNTLARRDLVDIRAKTPPYMES